MKKFFKFYINILPIISLLNSVVYATESQSYTDISRSIAKVLAVLSWIGYAVCLGMLLFIGAKYTMAAANERATLKGGLVNYFIGIFLIAGASTIAALFSGIASGGVTGKDNLSQSLIDAATNL